MQPLLEIKNVEAHYGAIQALRGVDLAINHGEIVTLIGANGAGKSTLLMTIFGQPRASKGQIYFNGQDITARKTGEIARMKIAQVPEGRRIFSGMTVLENLQLGGTLAPKQNYARNLDYVFALFPRLAERQQQRAGTMSGGEQQMLAISRALMGEPALLMLDEPSLGSGAFAEVKQIFEIIRTINKQGTTIFLVEQNANQALKIADRAYVMVNGKITMSGKGTDLLNDPQVRAAYLEGH